MGGKQPHGEGFRTVPVAGCHGGQGSKKGRKGGFGPDIYFGHRGWLGPSDGAKHSLAIFLPRVAGTTLPPAPARHPHRAPFVVTSVGLRERRSKACLPCDFGGVGSNPWVSVNPNQSVPSSRPATISDAYGHTTGNTPEPVRFQKLSLVRPS